jgi:hypothetical protein
MKSLSRHHARSALLLAMSTASALLFLPGCPNDPVSGSDTLLTINNQFPEFNITNIRMIAPADTAPSANILSGAVANGTAVEITLTAPDQEVDPDGVVWTAIVSGQLQRRAKQSTPNDLRPALNADFNDLDTDGNSTLSLAEIQTGFPDFTPFNLDVFDLNGSNGVELNETGANLRFATATFTCVHDGDQLVWNFNGESPADHCADTP